VGRGTLDRVGGDPPRGRARRDGARGRPRRARRRPPVRFPRRRTGMTVLVTGASGLVGSHVVEALVSRGEGVRALVRPASRDAVGSRLVHIASVAVYGGSAAYPTTRECRSEDYAFQPIPDSDFYGRTKRMAEAVVREAGQRREVDAVALRPTVIYGERDRLFTPRVIRILRLPLVPRIGAGTNRLACVYAGNVAAAALAALAAPERGFRAYNVTSDGPPVLSQREFFAAFAAALGRRYRPLPIPAPLAATVAGLLTAHRLARAAVS